MMSIPAWAADPLTEIQEAVREHFVKGGSVTWFLVAIAAIVFALLLVHLITRWQDRHLGTEQRSDPVGVFDRLLDGLGVLENERSLLKNIARESGLHHPTAMLLCPAMFDECVVKWQAVPDGSELGTSNGKEAIQKLRSLLFEETRVVT